jgi:hypothetical protein
MNPRLVPLLAALVGCSPDPDTGPTDDTAPPDDTGPALTLTVGTRVNLGSGAFARVLPRSDGIAFGRVAPSGEHLLQAYDPDWQPTGEEIELSAPGPREPDLALEEGDAGVFHARLTREEGNGVEIRSYDDAWAKLASTDHLPAEPDKRALDPSLLVSSDRIWLGSEYRQDAASWEGNIAPSDTHERGLLLRELTPELELIDTHRLTATIPGAEPSGQFWGLGGSQLRDERGHWVFAAAATGDTDQFPAGESAGTRSIFALEYDLDLAFVQAHGPLTPADQDAYWCTGAWQHAGLTFVSYTFRQPEDGGVMGPPTPDQGNIGLMVLDEALEVLLRSEITDHSSDTIADNGGAHRSSVVGREDSLWVSWDDGGGVWVQELLLGWE